MHIRDGDASGDPAGKHWIETDLHIYLDRRIRDWFKGQPIAGGNSIRTIAKAGFPEVCLSLQLGIFHGDPLLGCDIKHRITDHGLHRVGSPRLYSWHNNVVLL